MQLLSLNSAREIEVVPKLMKENSKLRRFFLKADWF